MTKQEASANVVARIEQATAEIKIASAEVVSLPKQLTDIVAEVGARSSIGTIVGAWQYASGSYTVQYNYENNSVISEWPQWAFELAKAALLGSKRVSVISNGVPVGANLVGVGILPYASTFP